MQFQLQDIFWAANPSLDLSVTKSDFKSNNWILCIMHMFQSVSRTCNHNIIHANMTDRECGIRCTEAEWGFHNTWIFVQISLSVCCMSFWVFFYWGAEVAFSSAFHFRMTAANELKKGSCVWPESDVLSTGKWMECYNWPAFSECKSQLVLAQPNRNAGCWPTLSPIPQILVHGHENEHF